MIAGFPVSGVRGCARSRVRFTARPLLHGSAVGNGVFGRERLGHQRPSREDGEGPLFGTAILLWRLHPVHLAVHHHAAPVDETLGLVHLERDGLEGR